ncbi:hypothetical protein JKP88DRAFT_254723 [Tribonema minus]|uniref:Uncharacterized protein n=1 Tax=Tribonema minus TaxID=303371 RepID=A0A836CGN6_9STRA|nr:hypothetical protein JKP88DRAFT_254723 [Tribonema minus]
MAATSRQSKANSQSTRAAGKLRPKQQQVGNTTAAAAAVREMFPMRSVRTPSMPDLTMSDLTFDVPSKILDLTMSDLTGMINAEAFDSDLATPCSVRDAYEEAARSAHEASRSSDIRDAYEEAAREEAARSAYEASRIRDAYEEAAREEAARSAYEAARSIEDAYEEAAPDAADALEDDVKSPFKATYSRTSEGSGGATQVTHTRAGPISTGDAAWQRYRQRPASPHSFHQRSTTWRGASRRAASTSSSPRRTLRCTRGPGAGGVCDLCCPNEFGNFAAWSGCAGGTDVAELPPKGWELDVVRASAEAGSDTECESADSDSDWVTGAGEEERAHAVAIAADAADCRSVTHSAEMHVFANGLNFVFNPFSTGSKLAEQLFNLGVKPLLALALLKASPAPLGLPPVPSGSINGAAFPLSAPTGPMQSVLSMLNPRWGCWAGDRIVCVGDYSDSVDFLTSKEEGELASAGKNLYRYASENYAERFNQISEFLKNTEVLKTLLPSAHHVAVNLDKQEYLDPVAFGSGKHIADYFMKEDGLMQGVLACLFYSTGGGGGDIEEVLEAHRWAVDRLQIMDKEEMPAHFKDASAEVLELLAKCD